MKTKLKQIDMFAYDTGSGWAQSGDNPKLGYSDTGASKEAALSLEGGAADRMRDMVFLHIKERGRFGSTDDEGCHSLGCTHNSYAPRRTELAKSGAVVKSGERRQTRSGRSANVWILNYGLLDPSA